MGDGGPAMKKATPRPRRRDELAMTRQRLVSIIITGVFALGYGAAILHQSLVAHNPYLVGIIGLPSTAVSPLLGVLILQLGLVDKTDTSIEVAVLICGLANVPLVSFGMYR